MSPHRRYLNEGTCIGFLTYRKKSVIGQKPDSTTQKSFEVAGTSGLTSAPNDLSDTRVASNLRKPAVDDSLRMLKTFDITKHSIAHTRIEHVINTVPHSPPASRPYTQPDKEEAMNSMDTSTSISIIRHEHTVLPLYFILSDSHGKNLPSISKAPHYQITTRSISGLQWMNTYNHTICTQTVLNS
ncbi:unnamed protein product, partial [Rotaria magnacalcarata]